MKVLPLLGFGYSAMALTAAGQSPDYIASLTPRNEATAIVKQSAASPKKTVPTVHWERSRDVKTGAIDKRSYKEMVNQSQFLATFLQDSCISPAGTQAIWHGEFTAQGKASDRQLSSAVIGEFLAGSPDSSAGLRQAPEIHLVVNDPGLLYHDTLMINNKMYPILMATPVPQDGSLYFAAHADRQNGAQPNDLWLILGENTPSPYLPLTRKEYLAEATQELQAEKAMVTEQVKQQNPVRSESTQKADKEAAISMIEQTCSGTQLQIRMRSFLAKYKSDETQQQEAIEAATAPLDTTLKLMAQLSTTLPAEELERPAIVSVQAHSFQGFEDLITQYGMLVKPNPVFHASAAGSIVPNLFIAYLTPNTAPDAAGTEDRQHVQFTPEKLRSLLK